MSEKPKFPNGQRIDESKFPKELNRIKLGIPKIMSKELKDYTVEDIRKIRFPYNEEQLLEILEQIKERAKSQRNDIYIKEQDVYKSVLLELKRRGFKVERENANTVTGNPDLVIISW